MFANLEKFVRFPSDDTARESAPAPLQHTAEDHGVREPELVRQILSIDGRTFLLALIEVVADKRTRAGRIGTGTIG